MNYRLIIIAALSLLIISCKEKVNVDFNLPDNNDIDEITTLLIFHDTLPVFKKSDIPDTIISKDGHKLIIYPVVVPICIKLRKLEISLPDTSMMPAPLSFDMVSFESLYNIEIDNKKIFNSKDSIFFFTQNDTLFNSLIPKKLRDTLQLTDINEQLKKNAAQKYSANFYDISLPIFSADLKTAYVEIRHMCSLCGGASAYVLQKVDGHWLVKQSFGLWVS